MKKLLFVVALIAAIGIPSVFAQSTTLSPVLNDYYGIKDALVAGDARAAAGKAIDMMKAISSVNMKALPAADHTAFMSVEDKLSFDARHISESTDINHQREHFTTLSANMVSLAKQAHLSAEPIYEDYCPMKKSSWLSNGAEIKNPYFGKAMLTCGKVTTTFKP